MAIRPVLHDFSILGELGFERPPVGVKFEFFKPETIDKLEGEHALCEMIRVAQNSDKPFYMDKDNENCMGKGALGMMGPKEPGWAKAGLIGERMDIFKDAGSNMRCMTNYQTFSPGAVNYVAFAALPQLDFEPDLLVFTGSMDEVGIIMRALAYSTGEMWESKSTPVFQCSWLFTYPHISGKPNFIVMGSGHGTTARETYKSGEIILVVPSPYFPVILDNLKIMETIPYAWEIGRDAWLAEEEKIYGKLVSDTMEAGLE